MKNFCFQKQSFYLIHQSVTKVNVCSLVVNQNTFKTIAKERFTNNALYSNGLSLF